MQAKPREVAQGLPTTEAVLVTEPLTATTSASPVAGNVLRAHGAPPAPSTAQLAGRTAHLAAAGCPLRGSSHDLAELRGKALPLRRFVAPEHVQPQAPELRLDL